MIAKKYPQTKHRKQTRDCSVTQFVMFVSNKMQIWNLFPRLSFDIKYIFKPELLFFLDVHIQPSCSYDSDSGGSVREQEEEDQVFDAEIEMARTLSDAKINGENGESPVEVWALHSCRLYMLYFFRQLYSANILR